MRIVRFDLRTGKLDLDRHLSDLDRLGGIAEALGRLFWCLMVLGFATAVLGSAGTGLLVLLLGAASFVARAGLEDFLAARRGTTEPGVEANAGAGVTVRAGAEPGAAEPEITIYRSARRRRSRAAGGGIYGASSS